MFRAQNVRANTGIGSSRSSFTLKISKRSLLFLILHYFKYRRDEYARAKKFISNIHPFNNLNTFELDDLVEDLDIVYFKSKLNSSSTR